MFCVDGSRQSVCCPVLMAQDDLCVVLCLMARDDLCVVLC